MKRKFTRLFTQGVLMDIKILKKCVKANVPPLTFQEAYELSGRIINIVVSPASGAGNKDSLRLLNYLTAPNVLVWSAALASCAIPGIYAPVELMKKDEKTGKLTPYMEGNTPIKWEDGSVQADLPMQKLSELFNINHFIVSQCLLNGTRVVMADGSLKECERVRKGDRLLGHRGEAVVVQQVAPNQPRDRVWRIEHDDGSEYTVSSEHRVTVRCHVNPCISFTPDQHQQHRWIMRLCYMSAEVEWKQISWQVAIVPGEREEEAINEAEEEREEELLSKDDELQLLQSAEDSGVASVPLSRMGSKRARPSSVRGTRAELKAFALEELHKLGRSAFLVRGELAELSAQELFERRDELRWGSGGAGDRVTGFKVPLPTPEQLKAAAVSIHHPAALIAVGSGQYEPVNAGVDRASIVYQLWLNASGDQALHRIEELQRAHGIEVNRAAGHIHLTVPPFSDSEEQCSRAIDEALSFGTPSIIAFGKSARLGWIRALKQRAASGEFKNPSDSYEQGVRVLRFERIIDGSTLSTCVCLSPHPACSQLGELLSRSLSLAHGLPSPPPLASSSASSSMMSVPRILLTHSSSVNSISHAPRMVGISRQVVRSLMMMHSFSRSLVGLTNSCE